MNAKYGKISIGCFVAFWVFTGFAFLLSADHPCAMQGLLMFPFMMLSLLAGIICSIIGAVKKESPAWYWIVGLLLPLGVVLVYVLGIMGCLGDK